MSDDQVPATPEAYQPTIAAFDGLPEGARVNTQDPRYRDAAAAAHRSGLSQKQFSEMLSWEARRVLAQSKSAPPGGGAASAPRVIEGYDKMTFNQKLAARGHL